jgi:ribosomal protein S27E
MNVYECLMPYCNAEVYARRDVCDICWEDRRGQLDALPNLYVMTYAMLMPGSRQMEISHIHVPQVDPGVPINLVALDSLTYGLERLGAWASWAAQLAGQPTFKLRVWTTGKTFLTVVETLQAYDHRFASKDFAGEYCLDVWTTYRRLVVQCVSSEPRSLGVTCPVCDMRTVLTRHADEYALCLTCATTWPHSQLPKLRHAQRATP